TRPLDILMFKTRLAPCLTVWYSQRRPAVVDEVLEAVRRDIEGRSIERVLVSGCRPGPLRSQDLVNVVFDFRQVRFCLGGPYSFAESVERVERLSLSGGFIRSEESRACSQYRSKYAQRHRSQEDHI